MATKEEREATRRMGFNLDLGFPLQSRTRALVFSNGSGVR